MFQDLHRSALPELKVPLPQNKHLSGSEQESLLQTLQTCAVFQAAAFRDSERSGVPNSLGSL